MDMKQGSETSFTGTVVETRLNVATWDTKIASSIIEVMLHWEPRDSYKIFAFQVSLKFEICGM